MKTKILFFVLMVAFSWNASAYVAGIFGLGRKEQSCISSKDSALLVRKVDPLVHKNDSLLATCEKWKRATDSGVEVVKLLQTEIKRKDSITDEHLRQFVVIAVNFMYIPYDRKSIEEYAIPAFEMTKGTPRYEKYQNRLEILKHYADDINAIVDLIYSTKGSADVKYARRLQESDVYRRYVSYEGWEKTYLGKKIVEIINILQTSPSNTKERLKEIRDELEALVEKG